jgi:hypothetical protein
MGDDDAFIKFKLPVPAADADRGDADARQADAQRKQALLDWALAVLDQLGLDQAVKQAQSLLELCAIKYRGRKLLEKFKSAALRRAIRVLGT